MRVTPLVWTPNPDYYAALAARNDYMAGDWVGEAAHTDAAWNPAGAGLPPDYSETIDGVSDRLVDDTHYAWACDHLGVDDPDDPAVEAEARTKALIDMLLDRGHFGPFEHPSATFAVEGISRVTMAQITRHRLASFDIQSFRYTQPDRGEILDISTNWSDRWQDMREYVVVPRVFEEYGPDDSSEGVVYEQVYLQDQLDSFVDYIEAVEWATDHGAPKARAKEDARYLLPQGAKVNMVVSMNLRQWMHIADIRAAADAHWEVREMTEALLECIEAWAPMTMEYYNENLKDRKNRLAP